MLQHRDCIWVTIDPASIHEFIGQLSKENELPYHINRLGHFKIYINDNYVEIEEDFCTHSDGYNLINIVHYGVFLHSDHKTTFEFSELKKAGAGGSGEGSWGGGR